ncbi:alpha-2-macroglobulin family protein [Scleromatobacter humisilvae]|uniref:Alpha-2-macroglobulin n=1 Tax=Scleromatobacter humisilvae TaxID=2897159 RepID=A0A9X1YJP1_9BURK|nr:MG2 domain-containing protein [Scleromatobacter humisilvae]MCK9687398.1 alpha-2-macroglobulin [Scleromatobacter humisilvae]
MRWSRSLVTGWIALVAAGSPLLARADATLKTMSPVGEVALVRQVRATFGESMVKFGDPRLPAPLDVACTPAGTQAGTARWVDDKTWVFDFAKDLPPGTKCSVAPHPGIRSVAGAAIAADAKFAFSTGGPAVVRAYPSPGEWQKIEEQQVFALLLNGPATTDSIERFAYCEFAGVGERVPVKVIAGATRDAILKAVNLVPQQARSVTLQCARPAAPEAKVSLVWGKGIATPNGVASTDDRRFNYAVRPAFTASFTCERVNSRADCLPMRPLRVEFSSPVPRRVASKVVLVGPDGKHAPQFEQHRGETADALVDLHESGLHKFIYFFGRSKGTVGDDQSDEGVTAVQFSDQLPEKADLRIELPPDFADDSGRRLDNAEQFPLKTRTSEAPALAKFPAATFGVLELNAEPVLPLTVRKIEGNLGIKAMTLGGAPARELTLADDPSIIEWFAKLVRYNETSLDRTSVESELGIKLPPPVAVRNQRAAKDHGRTKTQQEQDEDADESDVNAQDPNAVQTRTVSLLNHAANVRTVKLPAESQTEPHPFEVIGIPLPQPGYHVVEIESPRLGQALLDRAAPMYVRTGVLVTNLSVHFKWAPVNSGVWVTTLDKGKPVAGAAVQVSDCEGRKVWSGQTDAQGFARIDEQLTNPGMLRCGESEGGRWAGQTGLPNGYFVSARKTDAQGRADMAFVWSTWQEGIEAWRFNLNSWGGGEVSRELFHTVMDRTLLRAGQTVSMKTHARRELLTGLAMVDAGALPPTLHIQHEGSGDHFDFPLEWRAGRYAETVWKIPDDAKLGVYDVTLLRPGLAPVGTGSFRVEEFRLPAMIGRLVPPAGPQVDPRELTMDVMVNYGNGGGAANLPLKVSAQVRDVDIAGVVPVARYPGFHFEPPKASTAADNPGDGAMFSEEYVDEDDADRMVSQRDTHSKLVADKLSVTLDKSGAGKVTLSKLPPVTATRELLVQANYADPNGEVQTLSQTLPLWPAAVVLGVRTDDWVSVHQKLPAQVVALDTHGKPQAGVDVSVRAVVHREISARKRLVGGFYAYDNKNVDEDLGEVCSGKSDARGLVLCEATLETSGQVELIAQAKDAQGHLARAASSVWVTRAGEVWFGSANDDRMDVLPEQRAYEPGQTARFQIRSPFRHATALVAIERNGILETRTVELDGRDPTVEIPVKAEWAPNVFVSVLAVRGRVREVPWYSLFTWGWKSPVEWWHAWRDEGQDWQAPTAMVDLAKPAFKFGITEISVGDAAHRLKVEVVPDKSTYPIRATSQVRIKVTLPDGRAAPAGTEVTLAAVDEALLSLKANDSWNLFDAMIQRRNYGVETATAQMQIIGKRHFGKKAAPPGGGGGQFPTRELFDTLLLWNPGVVLDAKGEAVVSVPLNDSLTSFRIVAVADVVQGAQAALFGTGSATIAATQDLQIVSGVPPLVREGDHYQAMFTLRNTSKAAMNASLAASAGERSLATQTVAIAAGAAADVAFDVDVPFNVKSVAWTVAADAGSAHDRMKFAQKIAEAVPVTVQQATLMQLDKTVRIPIAPPANALSDGTGKLRGGIDVALKPRLGDGLPGVRDFFSVYPWNCFEQRASVAIGLRDTAQWHALVDQISLYQDEDGVLNYFPGSTPHSGSDSLTAYVLAISDEATKLGYDFALPADAKASMERGLIGFVEGRVNRDFWRPAFLKNGDLDVRKLAAIEALSRDGKVQPRMLDSIQILPNQWPTGAVIDWLQILDRVPAIRDHDKRVAEAEQILRARLNVQGTRLGFSTERDDSWWWLMVNGDVNSVRMTMAVLDRKDWVEDVPRIVTGTLQRQQFGRWSTTVANAWGSVAMEAFSKKFESVPVKGVTRAGFGVPGAATSFDWARIPAGGSLPLGWPAGFAVNGNKADANLQVDHDGTGKPWVTVTSRAAVPVTVPFGSGYRIAKTITPVEQKAAGKWSRGDVVRVHLDIDVQADATWVVVNDPVPGGAALLGTGLGNDDQISTGTEKDDQRGWLAYQERSFEAFRAYYRYLPKGAFSIEYTMRLNNPGRFGMPQTRVEAMYAPEMFGESPNAAWTVQP